MFDLSLSFIVHELGAVTFFHAKYDEGTVFATKRTDCKISRGSSQYLILFAHTFPFRGTCFLIGCVIVLRQLTAHNMKL